MSLTRVLKLPQAGFEDRPILIHVTQKKGNELDVDLLATDGDIAYRGKVRERSLNKHKAKNSDCTEAEWSQILRYAIVSKSTKIDEHLRRDLEVTCNITGQGPNSILSIAFRTRVEDITHRLGAIELNQTPEIDDVDLFGWACQIVDQRDVSEEQVRAVDTKIHDAQTTIHSLQAQLEGLVKAKAEHEQQLLSKFTLLLNEKKLKIRNQQRILQTANVNQTKLDQLSLTLGGEQVNTAGSSKRRRQQQDSVDEDDESDAFDPMEVDKTAGVDDEEDFERAQRAQSNTDTESENEDLDGSSRQEKELSPPPPPRSLPFKSGKDTKSAPPEATSSKVDDRNHDDESTASEDDEL